MNEDEKRQSIAAILRSAADGIESGLYFIESFNSMVEMAPRDDGYYHNSLSLEVKHGITDLLELPRMMTWE